MRKRSAIYKSERYFSTFADLKRIYPVDYTIMTRYDHLDRVCGRIRIIPPTDASIVADESVTQYVSMKMFRQVMYNEHTTFLIGRFVFGAN